MADEDQFSTSFARDARKLSRALDARQADAMVVLRRLTIDELLTVPSNDLIAQVLTARGGQPEGVGEPTEIRLDLADFNQPVAGEAELRGDTYDEYIPCWSWNLKFQWRGPSDLFGTWPDEVKHELAVFDNHPNHGSPPTIKWQRREDLLWATCYVSRTRAPSEPQSEDESSSLRERWDQERSTPPEDMFEVAAMHAAAYCNAMNRQIGNWRARLRSLVASEIERNRQLAIRGDAQRSRVNQSLDRFRTRPTTQDSDSESAAPVRAEPSPAEAATEAAAEPPEPERHTMSEADVVILTALPKETAAFQHHLDGWSEVASAHRRYFRGQVGDRTVVVWPTGGMGNVRSGVAAQQAIAIWNPGCILLAGIAAGLRRDKVQLGDVLVPEQVVSYEPSKVGDDASVTNRFDAFRASSGVLDAAQAVARGDWRDSIQAAPPEPLLRSPEAHFGVLLSGEKVIASAEWTQGYLEIWDRAIGVEMEAVGVHLAAYESTSAPLVGVIKSACDFADALKSDEWQEFAAATSAAFTARLVELLPVRKTRKQPQRIDSPLAASKPKTGWGSTKVQLCRRLTEREQRELADCFEIEPHERDGVSKDGYCAFVFEWLQRRQKLGELPDMLANCLGRDDLVDLVAEL